MYLPVDGLEADLPAREYPNITLSASLFPSIMIGAIVFKNISLLAKLLKIRIKNESKK